MENIENTTNNTNETNDTAKEWEKLAEPGMRELSPEDDLGRAGELLYEVDPFIFPDFLGDSEKAKVLGPELFNDTENGLFSFNRTLVADENGQLDGILCYRTSDVAPWDKEAVKERFEKTGVELPAEFERANDNYMKKITDAELPEGAAEIEFLATAPEARGKGIATKLINKLKDSGEFKELHLDVLGNNENALNLYKKLGFEVTDEFPCYPDGSVPVYHMVMKIEQ